jgi:flagellar basal-body rod protein FlgG
MSINALHSAATGMHAMETKIDVIANNLANVSTHGFRRSRANFEDLIYQEKEQPGRLNAQGDISPAGTYVGLGVKISNTQIMFRQGAIEPTGNQYDLAIEGNGFFQVRVPDDLGGGVAYTRAGNFFRNPDGELVLGNGSGYRLEPGVVIPDDSGSVTISNDGRVLVQAAGQAAPQEIGQIQMARFVNPAGLLQQGENIFIESGASGEAIEGVATEEGFGRIVQSHLERSNVDAVEELIQLIQAQRHFELNSQVIKTADEMFQVLNSIGR